MKKYLFLFLTLLLTLALVACDNDPLTTGSKEPTVSTTQPQVVAPTTAPTTPTEPHDHSFDWVISPTNHYQACTECGYTLDASSHSFDWAISPTNHYQACTECGYTLDASSHSFDWVVSLDNHYQACTECGYTLEASKHTLDEWSICTDCQAEVYTSEYGIEVTLFDEQGNPTLSLSYDLDGNLLMTCTSEYTYDNDGNMLSSKEYIDGALAYEAEYALDADGFPYTVKDTTYYEDGSRDYSEYDQWYNCTVSIWYDAEGNVTYNGRFEYVMNDDGLVIHQKAYENDILVSETEYGIIEDLYGAYTYVAKEITYFEDGSKLIYQYNEDGEIISEVYVDANGNQVDNSDKFDPTLCAPLFGTWKGEMLLSEEWMGIIGMEGFEGFSAKVAFSFTFTAEGKMLTKITIDPDSMLDFMVEFMYSMFESEYGMTRDEADAQLQQQMGMNMRDYVAFLLQSGDMADQLQQEMEMVYYVQGDQIFAGNSWTSRMEPQKFTLVDNVLTLIMTGDENEDIFFALDLTKAEDQNTRFDPVLCAPLFGTWRNDVTLPGAVLGFTGDIRANVTMTFTEQGVRTTTLLLNRDDFAAAFKELYYASYEGYGMTREEIDALILAQTGMTMDAFVAYYLETDEGKATLNQVGSDFYYVEGNTLYCGDMESEDMSVITFVVDDDVLTLTVYDPEYTYALIKEESNSSNSVINADDFTGDLSNWETDADDLIEIVDGKLHFNTNFPGDYCAAMLKQPNQNGTFRFTLTVNALSENYTEFWWDTELIIIARASRPGPSWYDDRSQTGYTISSWGDLSEFCLGRCGYDDAFGVFSWNINDGKSHVIEITTINNADNTAVEVIVTIDGEEVARVVDDGTRVKKERPNLYPDAGTLVIRAKWMDITIG